MTNTQLDHARPIAGLALALGLALTFFGGAALAGPGTQTEDDIYVGNKRKAQGVTTPAAAKATTTTPKPLLAGAATAPLAVPNTARSTAPAPSLLTKKPVQGVTTPGTATPQPRPGAGVSPNTGAVGAKKNARDGGDDDLDDLEVERRKVQGVNRPGTTTPPLRPGAGVSPNTGRTAPAPAALPGK